MRLHRFYVNKPLGEEIVVERAGFEKEVFHQWTRVFRYTSGDEVVLFSQATPGYDHIYSFSSLSKESATLSLVRREENTPALPITLVMALVKKDTFETIVRQATELGVSRIVPIIASRSEKKNLNFERLRTIAQEASEQCGRGSVPEISDIVSLQEAVTATKDTDILVGSLRINTHKTAVSKDRSLSLWVGPEGGWTEEEEAFLFENGAFGTKLGATVLKADTAAVALLSTTIQHYF